jgi:hypothetical protein
MKALRESAGEIYGLAVDLNEASARWRPAEDEWCMKDVIAHLRDADVLTTRQVELIERDHEPEIPHESLEVLPFERNYRGAQMGRLLSEYESAREELLWQLRLIDPDDWDRRGVHPYLGPISIGQLVRRTHEHDLEYLYQAKKLHEAARDIRTR